MIDVCFHSTDWEKTGWEQRAYLEGIPRRGDLVSLDGHPFHVADVAWCYKAVQDCVVYIELENASEDPVPWVKEKKP